MQGDHELETGDEARGVSPWIWVLVAVLLAAAAGAWWWWSARQPPPAAPVTAAAPAEAAPTPITPATPTAPPVAHPVEEPSPPPGEAAPPPLPALADSDAALRQALAADGGVARRLLDLLVGKDLVRRIVVVVDNLPREKVALEAWPLRRPAGAFVAGGTDQAPVIGAGNADRYRLHVEAIEALDMARVARLYARWYPLFQQAWVELGYPGRYFNDRLVEVIDHLLATPAVPQPVALARPGVLYEFADPALQSRSAGQKLLLRMGPAHAERLKRKLRELRAAVARQPALPAAAAR